MSVASLRILQLGSINGVGGAAGVATGQSRGYQTAGHRTWMVVGRRQTDDPSVLVLRGDRRPFL